jgi:hypothetical protein
MACSLLKCAPTTGSGASRFTDYISLPEETTVRMMSVQDHQVHSNAVDFVYARSNVPVAYTVQYVTQGWQQSGRWWCSRSAAAHHAWTFVRSRHQHVCCCAIHVVLVKRIGLLCRCCSVYNQLDAVHTSIAQNLSMTAASRVESAASQSRC